MVKDRHLQRWRENVHRTLPGVQMIVKRVRLDHLAAELTHRSRVALVRDLWVQKQEEILFDDCDCSVLLCLSGEKAGWGLFFSGEYPQDVFDWGQEIQQSFLGSPQRDFLTNSLDFCAYPTF